MTIAERLEYTHRRLLAAQNGEQEVAIFGEFFKYLSSDEAFPEVVRYFTTRLDDLILKLRQLTAQIKPPGQFARLENPQAWSALAWILIECKLPQLGRDLFQSMYEFQLSQQAELRRRFYKGVSLQNLGWASYLLGEHAAARRAVLLALVEEIINTLDMEEATQLRVVSANPAYLMLRQTFKIQSSELDEFVRFCRNYARTHSGRCAYPEDCYVGYLRSLAAQHSRTGLDLKPRVSHFNHPYFTTLLDMVGHSVTNDVAEALLADLACYLFATVDEYQLCEQDFSLPANGFNLVVRNSITDDPVLAELGAYFVVEWRYWARGLGATGLLAIAGKLRLAGMRTAILFTRDSNPNGASSEPSRMQVTAQQIYQQDRLMIIIITQPDLLEIERRLIDLPALLKSKVEALRFNRGGQSVILSPPAEARPPAIAQPSIIPTDIQTPTILPPPAPPAPPVAPPIAIQPIMTPEAAPAPTPAQPPKPPRLVIRNVSSNAKPPKPEEHQPQARLQFRTIENPNRPTENPTSLSYKAVVGKPIETPILKPCTECQNQTSLVCKTCARAFCNVHLRMSEMRCEDCIKAPAPPPAEPKEKTEESAAEEQKK